VRREIRHEIGRRAREPRPLAREVRHVDQERPRRRTVRVRLLELGALAQLLGGVVTQVGGFR